MSDSHTETCWCCKREPATKRQAVNGQKPEQPNVCEDCFYAERDRQLSLKAKAARRDSWNYRRR